MSPHQTTFENSPQSIWNDQSADTDREGEVARRLNPKIEFDFTLYRLPKFLIAHHPSLIPDTFQWCTFLRNHDELTLEMFTIEEWHWMWHQYVSIGRMRLNLEIPRWLAPLLDNDQRKTKRSNSLLSPFAGTPIIYYCDEIGMGDIIRLNNRSGLRTPMQWNDGFNAGFSQMVVPYRLPRKTIPKQEHYQYT